ncbi:MAG: competence type IV pilus major pilin ComGC [Thermacetogeniaceae bacterium]
MLNLRRQLGNEKGFTMIEMMVVLIIIAVLIAGGIKFYTGYIENSRVTKAKAQISTMQAALDAYFADKGKYPSTLSELIDAGINATDGNTLDAKDPWGQNYKYKFGNYSQGTNNACVIYTGYSKVQGKDGYYVAAECRDGALVDPPGIRVTRDTNPDGTDTQT